MLFLICALQPTVLAKPMAVALVGSGAHITRSPARATELLLAAFR